MCDIINSGALAVTILVAAVALFLVCVSVVLIIGAIKST